MTTQAQPSFSQDPYDDLLFAKLQGFYEYLTLGPDSGRTHVFNQDWNEAYDQGRNEAEALNGPEGRKPFSFPEIPAFMDDATYMRVSVLVEQAARLVGDGEGSEAGKNVEYVRGMAELILRVGGLSSDCLEGIVELIHNVAKESGQ